MINANSAVSLSDIDLENTLVVATGNAHKLTEIEAILSKVLPRMRFVALGDLGNFPEPEENGTTFSENAEIKARAALEATGCAFAIADDSGLVVDALDGAPGIYSARWAGVHGDDGRNNAKLLKELEGVSEPSRTARFHSSIVLVGADGSYLTGEGDCEGSIGYEPRGSNGFGYDPLFWPVDTPGKTMAELLPEEKNAISHRFHALQDLAAKLTSA